MVKAIMHGCNGAMGQVITNLIAEDPGIELVAGVDINTEQKNGYRYSLPWRSVRWRLTL